MKIIALLFALLSQMSSANVPPLPEQKVNVGKKTLYCVVVQWTNPNIGSAASCKSMGEYVADFYSRNSRGKLVLNPMVGSVSTGIAGTAANTSVGEKLTKQKITSDYYIIPNKFYGGDNSGLGVAHLSQILDTVATHETGHLLSLGHCTRADHSGCCDKGSIMNPDAKASGFLTAPQYYFLGWTAPSEYILWDGTVTAFMLQNPLKADGKLSTVIIPPQIMTEGGHQKYAFLSFPPVCDSGKPCAALHLVADPGNSQLIKEVDAGNTFYDSQYTGVNLVVGQVINGALKVTMNLVAPAAKKG